MKYIDAQVTSLPVDVPLKGIESIEDLKRAVLDCEKECFIETIGDRGIIPEGAIRFTATGRYDDLAIHISCHRKIEQLALEETALVDRPPAPHIWNSPRLPDIITGCRTTTSVPGGNMEKVRKSLTILIAVLPLIAGCTTFRGIPSDQVWSDSAPVSEDAYGTLAMPPDRPFRIVVLADIQLAANPFKEGRSLAAVRTMVEMADPDLIVTVGDNTAWISAHRLTVKLIRLMESFEIPWAVTLGNHDSEGPADREWHGNRYEEAEYSLFRSGPSNIQGIGNYGIRLVDTEGETRYLLIMMDSNVMRRYEDGRDYDYIYPEQIRWYERMVEGASTGGRIPSLLFFHIPLPEFREAVEAWNNGEIDESLGFGETREGVFSPPVNTGMFDAVKRAGSTTHIFVGHDHVNNLSVMYEGVRLTYVLKTGPGSYHDRDLQGGTLVTIDPRTQEVEVEHIYLGDGMKGDRAQKESR